MTSKKNIAQTVRIDILPSFEAPKDKTATGKEKTNIQRASLGSTEYQSLFQNSYDAMLLTRLDGSIAIANARAEELLECSEVDLRNMSISDIVLGMSDETLEAIVKDLQKARFMRITAWCARTEDEPFHSEIAVSYLHRSKSFRRNETDWLVFSIRDESVRFHAQAERERLLSAIEQVHEAVIMTDATGVIAYVNPCFSKITGYSREEIINKNAKVLESGFHDQNFYNSMWETLYAGQSWTGRLVNQHKDGSYIVEHVTITPVHDSEGAIVNFVAVERDITEQIRAEEEKASLQSQLSQAQKMESLGRLAGGVAHDFNNLLQAIMGYNEMAAGEIADNSPAAEYLREVGKATQRAAALVRQLQTFARKDNSKATPQNINGIIENILDMLRRLTGSKATIEWHPNNNICEVLIGANQMEQVVTNLITNACDAVSEGGKIVVSTDIATITPQMIGDTSDLKPGKYVCLSVTDNGSGMSPDVIAKIFDPFFTTKPAGKGTGLGLALVFGAVKQNGGHVTVESAVGEGTSFTLYFPCSHAGSVATKQDTIAKTETNVAKTKNKTVLLVDDEASVLNLARQSLSTMGYRVITANSAQEALTLSQALWDEIDLVISDVVMPGMSGPEMIKLLLQERPQLKYMFISGHTSNLISKHGLIPDETHFIGKPFSFQELHKKIDNILAAP